MTSTTTQNAAILHDLKRGKKISPLDALHAHGCFRLAARIYDLRCEGHQIEKFFRDVGDHRRVAVYYLAK